jgi:hypothetical protein
MKAAFEHLKQLAQMGLLSDVKSDSVRFIKAADQKELLEIIKSGDEQKFIKFVDFTEKWISTPAPLGYQESRWFLANRMIAQGMIAVRRELEGQGIHSPAGLPDAVLAGPEFEKKYEQFTIKKWGLDKIISPFGNDTAEHLWQNLFADTTPEYKIQFLKNIEDSNLGTAEKNQLKDLINQTLVVSLSPPVMEQVKLNLVRVLAQSIIRKESSAAKGVSGGASKAFESIYELDYSVQQQFLFYLKGMPTSTKVTTAMDLNKTMFSVYDLQLFEIFKGLKAGAAKN